MNCEGLTPFFLSRMKKYQVLFQVYRHRIQSYNQKFRNIAALRLDLLDEELEFIWETLCEERVKGEWDKPFEFEKQV